MNIKRVLAMAAVFAFTVAFSLGANAQRERISFDKGWRFAFGDASDPMKDFGCGTEYFNYFTKANSIHNAGPYSIKFHEDSAQWRTVDLPYDFVVDLPFAEEASYSHGHKTVGWKYPKSSVGWYRKTFHLPESDRGKHVRLQFDGIFRNAQVWVNGVLVGTEPSGYKQQDYDITDYLLYGNGADRTNLVCVRADATFEEGWFYEGGGIYRHTWLVKSSPVHITTGGTFVYSDIASDFKSAKVYVETEIRNDLFTTLDGYTLEHEIIAPNGNTVAISRVAGKALRSRESETTTTSTLITNPQLWSTDTPYLYKVRTKVLVAGSIVDSYITRTGFRNIRMDKDKGLFLNGKHVKLKGFNNHQDHAGVGAAIPDGLQLYRMEQLKSIGCNAYRASHNPMTSELLDVCDSLGILVFEENRLMGMNDFQMSVGLNMIRRHRNHPSIFLWGLCNEEWGLEWDERSINIAKNMMEQFHLADPTRLVSCASSSGPQILKGVDVAGYNYVTQHPIDEHRRNYPQRLALGSEETSGCGTRGVYFHEKPTLFKKQKDKDNEDAMFVYANSQGRMPSRNRYADLDHDSSMNRIERGWKFYDERPWLMGLFYWTGFDYRGEPVPLAYPATGSLFGVFDYCGFPKDEAYYLKSWWKPEETTLHILPHWNLQGHEGETIDLWVYSNCDEVELRVNGKKMGKKAMPRNGHLSWQVAYQPGTVEAVGYKNGKKTATRRIETTGKAVQAKVEKKQYGDVTVVNISMLDKKGRFVPTACETLNATITGNIRFLGWGNGDSAFTDTERPSTPDARHMQVKTFNGLAQIILQSKDAGPFGITVKMQ
uniref:Beta-galactosidase GalA n=1 Tax=Prevotella sp. GTC17262 TaxID=3236797 RepID=A0AB33JIN7_9BACT